MSCLVCSEASDYIEFPLGYRPLSSEFSKTIFSEIKLFDMTLMLCQRCHTLQLKYPPKYTELIPSSASTKSNEPEEHLDLLLDDLATTLDEGVFYNVCAISYKDITLLKRFKKRFQSEERVLDLNSDLGISAPNASIESIQDALSSNNKCLNKLFGLHTLVVARHILEHVSNLHEFLKTCTALLEEGGYLLIEIPDCTQNLLCCDYTMVWEEHTLYLDLNQLSFILNYHGLQVVYSRIFPLAFESSIVVVAKKSGVAIQNKLSTVLTSEIPDLFMTFANRFETISNSVKRTLSKEHANGNRIAIFGAGHLACAFIHYFSIQDFIQFCFDDSPNKIARFLPGTSIPILASSELSEHNIDLLLSAVSITNEEKVLKRFRETDGVAPVIYSIFVNSPISLFNKIFV